MSINKYSPTTGERLFTSRDIGERFGVSANLINHTLVNLGILKKYKGQLSLSSKDFGEEVFFDTSSMTYVSEKSLTSNHKTIKFNLDEFNYLIDLIIRNFPEVYCINRVSDLGMLCSDNFPKGRFAMSFREAGDKYNVKGKNSVFFLSKRESRNGELFSDKYIFISDKTANDVRDLFSKFYCTHPNILPSAYRIPVIDFSDQTTLAVLELFKHEVDLAKRRENKTVRSMTKDIVKHNKKILGAKQCLF